MSSVQSRVVLCAVVSSRLVTTDPALEGVVFVTHTMVFAIAYARVRRCNDDNCSNQYRAHYLSDTVLGSY